MKIKRTINGQEYEFELQPIEIRKAYEELRDEYMRNDVLSAIANKCAEALPYEKYGDVYGEEIILNDNTQEKYAELIGKSVDRSENGLSKNENYWDSYWKSLDYGVEAAFMGSAPDSAFLVEAGADDTVVVRHGEEKILEVKREEGENQFYVYNPAFVLEHSEKIKNAIEKLDEEN